MNKGNNYQLFDTSFQKLLFDFHLKLAVGSMGHMTSSNLLSSQKEERDQ